jgi:hypothetical protein
LLLSCSRRRLLWERTETSNTPTDETEGTYPLDGEELLAIFLDVFGEAGLRVYIVGHLEGIADAMEDLEEEDE